MTPFSDEDETAAAYEASFDTPSTHRVATRWKWIIVLSAPILAGLMAWATLQIVQDYRSGRGWDNLWFFGFMLATLGGLVLLALAALVWAFRARLVLTGDAMTLRGIFGTRVIPVQKIEGYRWANHQLFLYPHGDQWPANLSYFEKQEMLFEWVFYHAPNLSAVELAEEGQAISRDLALGMTEPQKEVQLARLRTLARTMNWTAYCAAAAGLLNAIFLEDPTAQEVAAAVLVPLPVAMLLLALRNPGRVRLDYREGSRYPEILTGSLACSLALGLMSLLDPHTVLGDAFYRWFVPIAAANGALWVYIEIDRIRELYARRWLLAALTVVALFFLSGFWVGGGIYQVNKNFDTSEAAWGSTEVVGKRTESHKTGTTYHIKVAPWDGSGGEPIEMNVSKEQFVTLEVGVPVDVGVRGGALKIPWVAEIRPAKKRFKPDGRSGLK